MVGRAEVVSPGSQEEVVVDRVSNSMLKTPTTSSSTSSLIFQSDGIPN